MKLTTTIDVQLGRGQNMREHYAVRAKRVKAEREATHGALLNHEVNLFLAVKAYDDKGARITLHRPWARVALDSDNLSGSFKGVRDEIAAFLGVDDKSERLHWIYTQSKQPKGTLPTVTIEVMPVQDIDPQVKRVRELDACLRAMSDSLVGVAHDHREDGPCFCHWPHAGHKEWCRLAREVLSESKALLTSSK